MGYTHYYQFKTEKISKTKFKKAVALFKRCLDELDQPNLLGNGIGEGKPTITNTKICFNGRADRRENYESFYIDDKDTSFNFCKTAREPYDVAVCLCLLSFKEIFGDEFSYSSDGITREDIANPTDFMKDYSAKHNYTYKVEEEWQAAYDIFDNVEK